MSQLAGDYIAKAIRDSMPTAQQVAAAWQRAARILNCRHDWSRKQVSVEGYEIIRCRNCGTWFDEFPDGDTHA